MRNGRWRMLAVLLVALFTGGCAEAPNSGSAVSSSNEAAPSGDAAPLMTVNQLMHGILFPLGNTVFFAQAEDPAALGRDPEPSTSTNPLAGLYGGWQAVENSAL